MNFQIPFAVAGLGTAIEMVGLAVVEIAETFGAEDTVEIEEELETAEAAVVFGF